MKYCFFLYLTFILCCKSKAQDKVNDYYWYPTKGQHLNTVGHFRIKDSSAFEYSIMRPGRRSSFSFGKILKEGDRHIMLCQTNSFPLFIKSFPNDTVPRGHILISPFRYLDSSFVDAAYALLDGNRKYINPYIGLTVTADFHLLKIHLLDMFYTNEIHIDSLKGTELQVTIGAPFQLDDFLLETNGFYFTISPDKQELQLFKSDGTLNCIFEKREVAQKND